MKLLFLREKTDIRLQLLKTKLEELGHRIDVFDMVNYEFIQDGKSINVFSKKKKKESFLPYILFKRIFSGLKIFRLLDSNYDVCHIFNIKRQNFWLIPLLKRKVKKIVVMVFGPSTFEFPTKKFLFRKVYKYVDVITFSNPEYKDLFNQIYKFKFENKTKLMMIPFKIFKEIDALSFRESSSESADKLGINFELTTVLCSTSGMALENHFEVIDAINNIKNYRDNFLFLFMLTYGGTTVYIEKVKNYIKEKLINYHYLIFDKYLSNDDVARLRQATKIMINVRDKDQITGHMLESLYSGAIVICGDWLPYKILDTWNVFYIKISSINEIPKKLLEIMNNYEDFKLKAKNNKLILQNQLNEGKIVNDWLEIYRN